jgi:hypothetical protein
MLMLARESMQGGGTIYALHVVRVAIILPSYVAGKCTAKIGILDFMPSPKLPGEREVVSIHRLNME